MKKPSLNLRNSIYQSKVSGGYNGLEVKGGMLINNRVDGQSGISLAVQAKKSARIAEKVAIIGMANSLSEGSECGCDD
jgi:hypothetical protein